MLTKIQLQNLDQTSANIAILQIWSKQNKRITSRVLWNMRAHVFLHARARACYTCEHVLPTRASTCFLHVRARYLFVRARLLFKNVRSGQLKKTRGSANCLIKSSGKESFGKCDSKTGAWHSNVTMFCSLRRPEVVHGDVVWRAICISS